MSEEILNVKDRIFVTDDPLTTASLATVEFVGHLKDLKETRVGVAFDLPKEGRHDGVYEGDRIFNCAPNCGAFLKVSKILPNKTLEDFLNFRYKKHEKLTEFENSKKFHFVGEEKVKEHFKDLGEIKNVEISFQPVNRAGDLSNFVGVKILALDFLTVTNLKFFCEIVGQLKNLEEFSLCFAKFSNFDAFPVASENLQTLVLNGSPLPVEILSNLLKGFQNLRTLSLGNFGLKNLDGLFLPNSLKDLKISQNLFTDWVEVSNFLKNYKNLEKIDLSENPGLGDVKNCEGKLFENVKNFSISHCEILTLESFRFFGFENFESLNVLGNFFYEKNEKIPETLVRQFLVAICPNLKALNRSEIKKNQRANNELYFFNVIQFKFPELVKTFDENLTILEGIRKRHGIEELPAVDEGSRESTAPNAFCLKNDLVEVSVFSMGKPVELKIPSTMLLGAFRQLVKRKVNWPMGIENLGMSFAEEVSSTKRTALPHSEDNVKDLGSLGMIGKNLCVFLDVVF